MSEGSLYQLMLRESDDAPQASATDDLRRGQRRLRRRRIGVTVAAAACGVLAASVTAYGVGGMTDLTSGPATQSEDHSDGGTQFEVNNAWPPAKQTYARVREVVFDHTEYGQHAGTGYTPHAPLPRERAWRDAGLADSFGYSGGETAEETRLGNVTWDRTWLEDSKVGTLSVDVDSGEDPGRWSSTWMTRCYWFFRPHLFASCEERTTADGKTVLVGIDRRPVGLWMTVHWKQPDGTLVQAGFYGVRWPEAHGPSLTIDDLMNVATDPRLTIVNDD
jgi:hypothetical protein